jgi:phage gp46-like protein
MIALVYDNDAQLADLVRDGGNIQTDETLETAVLISLFTRRRARNDDELPEPLSHREGWWADPYADVEGDLVGSRLWLLRRSKTTTDTLNQAKNYCEEALQWLVDDGVADTVEVEVERHDDGLLAFKVEITKPTDPASRWLGAWTAHLEEL